jgi:hypothetical protein
MYAGLFSRQVSKSIVKTDAPLIGSTIKSEIYGLPLPLLVSAVFPGALLMGSVLPSASQLLKSACPDKSRTTSPKAPTSNNWL